MVCGGVGGVGWGGGQGANTVFSGRKGVKEWRVETRGGEGEWRDGKERRGEGGWGGLWVQGWRGGGRGTPPKPPVATLDPPPSLFPLIPPI